MESAVSVPSLQLTWPMAAVWAEPELEPPLNQTGSKLLGQAP